MSHVEGMKTLFVSGMAGDTRRYRCFHQQEQLAFMGVETAFRESDDPQLMLDGLVYDVFVLQRVPYSPLIALLIDVAHLRGKPVIFETDDLVFDPTLHAHIGFIDTLSVEAARKFKEDLARQAETFARCDCVLTTTQFLADEAQRRGKPAYVSRNAPSMEMVRISEKALETRRQRLEQTTEALPLVIAYFSGTGSHNRDFAKIAEPLVKILETYPHVCLHVSGQLALGEEFSPFYARIRRAPYVSWRELPHLIARTDINLAPLELDNPFCQAKSENKFVEAALVGVPTIASRTEAFEFAVTDGQDGLLVGSIEAWEEALRLLIEDPPKRRAMGEAARRTVYAHYLPEQRAAALLEIFEAIVARYSGSSSDETTVLRKLVDRAKHYANQMQADIEAQAAQMDSLRRTLAQYEDQLAAVSRSLENRISHLNTRVTRQDEIIHQDQEMIQHQQGIIQEKEELLQQKEALIQQKDQLIEEIMQGRVMRVLTGAQKLWRRMTGHTTDEGTNH